MIFSVRDSSQNFNGLHLGVHLCRLISNRAGISAGYIADHLQVLRCQRDQLILKVESRDTPIQA